MADAGDVRRAPMASAPMQYAADGSVDWGNMWDTYCALALEDGPPHRGTMLYAPVDADPTTPAYRFALAELTRGIQRVSGLAASPAESGWLALRCLSPAMAAWLAEAAEAEGVQARAEDETWFIPVGEWSDVTKEIKNVITVVAKTTHYWVEHLPADEAQAQSYAAALAAEPIQRVHTEPVVLDIGDDVGSLVIFTEASLRGAEIELVHTADAKRRTHVDVAERRHGGRVLYAAVYPPVAAGDYAIWIDYATPAGDVTIVGGEVIHLDWRAPAR